MTAKLLAAPVRLVLGAFGSIRFGTIPLAATSQLGLKFPIAFGQLAITFGQFTVALSQLAITLGQFTVALRQLAVASHPLGNELFQRFDSSAQFLAVVHHAQRLPRFPKRANPGLTVTVKRPTRRV
ncbi:hypothetical protein Pan216_35550 [Planctomycetes bacterium Pan216]|uniref:Uncharacterized protein n=1 Tax=Kolteria novifilia TaxID=2527975 RepID=A0A518B6U0_9BACT|nr:hypothetical protein Pan216_35550 [Planctomycetes bacterium Pan216]